MPLKSKSIIVLIIGLGLLIVIVGYSIAIYQDARSAPQPAIPDTVWQLDSIVSTSGIKSQFAFDKPQIQFVSETQFRGNDGCNTFCGSVKYSTKNGSFKVDGVGQTLLLCIPGSVFDKDGRIDKESESLDTEFLEILSDVEDYELDDNNELRLYGSNSRVLVFHSSSEQFRYKYPLCISY